MSSSLYSLGRWAAQQRRWVFAAWLALLVVLGGITLLTGGELDDGVSIPGTESQEALDTLGATFPEISGASAQVLAVAPDGQTVHDPQFENAVEAAVEELAGTDHVMQTLSPYDSELASGMVSEDEQAALIQIQMDEGLTEVPDSAMDEIRRIAADLGAALPDGSHASYGGELFGNALPELSVTEALGVAIALVVLVLTLGSLIAAGMPLLNALAGVGVSTLLIFIVAAFAPINSTTPMLALMLGLAVGIDYALFIVARHQDQLRHGMEVEESIGRALATAGSAVVFAGLTVMIALLGLGVAGIPFLTTMGVAAAAAVGVTVLVSLTLIPALLASAGERLRKAPRKALRKTRRVSRATPADDLGADENRAEENRAEENTADENTADENTAAVTSGRSDRFFRGWVRAATRWPVVTIVVVLAGVIAVAAPALHLRLALPDAASLPEDDPARVTYELVEEHFGEGFNGPLIVTGSILTSTDPLGLMDDLTSEIEALGGVDQVLMATPNPTADTGIIQVIPEGAPDSEETKELVHELRAMHDRIESEYNFDLSVTGFTAIGIDVSEKLGAALVPFGIVVAGLSLVLLAMVFRSIAVPIKATVGYLLSVAAAFGAVALVFEDGVLAGALGVARLGPVLSFMPIVAMGVLFGLAMDYQVFLVTRIREDYVHSGKARESIETGFVGAAKVVTAAAVIMVAVFVAFVPEGDANIKPIALGLAVGVFVDAFLVRMTLVPAVLALLGEKAWWIPAWLDRRMPSFDVEGEGIAHELALTDWPAPGNTDAVVAQGLTSSEPGLFTGVDLAIPRGQTTAITAETPEQLTALLLTVAGRRAPGSGRLKTCGYVVPERASSVRRRVAYVHLIDDEPRPQRFTALEAVLTEEPDILILDGADDLGAAAAANLQRVLENAQVPTVIVGTVSGRAEQIVQQTALAGVLV